MPAKIEITGQRFGRLLVLGEAGRNLDGKVTWHCRCDCGKTTEVIGTLLRREETKSCGCAHGGQNATHQLSRSRIYSTWRNMINRVTNPNVRGYAYYGGRGITVCEPWRKFENFLADMGPTYRDDLSIDRIDSNGDYEPGNCRWVTQAEQNRNKRSNVQLAFHGHTLIMSAWSERLGIPYTRLAYRVSRGWPPERALTEGVALERVTQVLEELEREVNETR